MTKKLRQFKYGTAAAFLVLLSMLASAQMVHAQNTTLQQRLDQYKTARAINTKENAKSIQAHCVIAQAKLKDLQAHVAGVQKVRGDAYKNITDLLADLQTKLNNQAFEITSIKAVSDTYNNKVGDYTSNLSAYKQALDDSVAVDCVKDPYGFKGALETARLYHDRMVPSITDIRSYLTNTVKPSLTNIKTALESGDTTGSSLNATH